MSDLLTIERVSLAFGGIAALSEVSVAVAAGRVTAVIGPNGAGKTSLFNVISGFYRPNAGTVTFDGKDILSLPGHARSTLGIARTFQNIALFDGMTVLENIKLGAHAQLRANVFSAGIYMVWARREEDDLTRRIEREVLTLPRARGRARRPDRRPALRRAEARRAGARAGDAAAPAAARRAFRRHERQREGAHGELPSAAAWPSSAPPCC